MGTVEAEVSGGDYLKKSVESLCFIAVAVAVIFSLRFVLGSSERTEHEYKYAGALNLQEKKKQVAEETTEETEKQEDLVDETEQNDTEEEETADNSAPQGEDDDSDTGNSNGSGDEGDGSGETPGKTTVTARPTPAPTPKPTPEPTPKPKATTKPTEAPEDKIKEIKCSWPDKDALVYGKDIPLDSLTVTAVRDSGKEEKISKDEYEITGLRNNVCGKHKLTVIYGDLECRLTYTVANYIVRLEYYWEYPDKCYKGEIIDDNVLDVTAIMADGTDETIPFGDYVLSGVDNELVNKQQNFTIRYKGFEVSGTCTFHPWEVTVHNIYCSDDACKDVVHEVEGSPQEVEYGQRISTLKDENTVKKYEGKSYKYKKEVLKADGNTKAQPYIVKSREFDIHIYRYFVLEE